MNRARCLATLVVLAAVGAARAQTAEELAESARPPLKDPTILLLRDQGVRKELGLKPEQAGAIGRLFFKHNRLLLAIRDVGPTGADEASQPALAEIRGELKTLLDDAQRQRLFGLALQAQGYDSLSRDDVAERLKLSDEQREQMAEIMENFWTAMRELQQADSSRSADELKSELDTLQAERLQQILELLDQRQAKRWSALLGEPYDLTSVRSSPAWAPEFEEVDQWVNAEPLTMQGLRGKVAVVHFFAFNCINCIHNYPWYREWQERYAGKDVAIIGIHTPETEAETDNGALRKKLAENGLEFPVAVDKSKKNWAAWSNNIWPAVYLVDKRGCVRYWWYGELDWQGAGGQKLARQRIDELLAEPGPAAQSPAVSAAGSR